MKKISLTIIYLFAFTFTASAATLTDALKITFQNNLELKAERKNLEVQREVLNISKSDFFPTLTLSGTKNLKIPMNLQIKVEPMLRSLIQIR